MGFSKKGKKEDARRTIKRAEKDLIRFNTVLMEMNRLHYFFKDKGSTDRKGLEQDIRQEMAVNLSDGQINMLLDGFD